MDREKIEQAYKKFINENRSLIGNEAPLVADAFEAAVIAVMSLPLSERLTEEEKEKIIKRYNDELEVAQHHTLKMKESVNPTSRQFHANVREGYISRLKLLEQIFGSDLFREK